LRFLAQRSALGIAPGSGASRALAGLLARACAAPVLPEPGDLTTLLDSDARGVSMLVQVRRVSGHNLWVWYRESGRFLDFVELTDHPPGQ
jgi:hypothetical protein